MVRCKIEEAKEKDGPRKVELSIEGTTLNAVMEISTLISYLVLNAPADIRNEVLDEIIFTSKLLIREKKRFKDGIRVDASDLKKFLEDDQND